jgi:hypothetical protein
MSVRNGAAKNDTAEKIAQFRRCLYSCVPNPESEHPATRTYFCSSVRA